MQQKGFTLVELLLSMAFFSFILMFVVFGFVQINRSYTRGLTTREVQNSTRAVAEELTRAIRDAKASEIRPLQSSQGGYRLCIGDVHYAWNMHNGTDFTTERYSDAGSVFLTLARTTAVTDCANDAIERQPGSGGETVTLLEEPLVIQFLDVTQIGASNSYRVRLVVSTDARTYPDDFDAFGLNAACDPGAGDQFCDVARVDTVVTARN